MSKKIKIILAALAISTMVGCQNNNKEGLEQQNNKIEHISNENESKLQFDDGKILAEKSDVINNFISNTALEISKYLKDGDMISTVAYANGIVKNDKRGEIDLVVNNLPDEMKTTEGKKLAQKLSEMYFEYMHILDLVSEGKLNAEVNNKLSALNEKMMDVNTQIINFSMNQQ